MYDELEKIDALEDQLEDSEEDSVEDEARDITDKFEVEDYDAPNLDVKVVEAYSAEKKLKKLSAFLKRNEFIKESYDVLKLANASVLSDAEELKEKIREDILGVLSEAYSENFSEWNYDTDYNEEILRMGFSELETQFVRLADEGLRSLEDLNVDEALEALWAASGLTPEGHHDFDDNLASLQSFQDRNLNEQSDSPGRDDVLEIREDIARKVSEWVEYRVPDFELLKNMEPDELLREVKTNLPSLSDSADAIYEEWEEFLDSIPDDQKDLFDDKFAPDEIPAYTELASPDYYDKEEPIGTSSDLERLEESLFDEDREYLEDRF
jgi:hypothetical protein